jgi:prepilin peptidase CpaA
LSDWWFDLGPWLSAHSNLMFPLLLSLGMAGCDLKTRRIPNYLTLSGVLGGVGFQLGYYGLPGFLDALAGLGLGFGLLLGPYLLGGMGAGDVKASAALGAWLGLGRAFALFVFTGLCGGLIVLAMFIWQRRLLAEVRAGGDFLLNWLLCRPFTSKSVPSAPRPHTTLPYGVAMALGMVMLCWHLA